MFTAAQLSVALEFLMARGHIKHGATLDEVLENHKQRSLLVGCARQHAISSAYFAKKRGGDIKPPDRKSLALPPSDRE